MPLSVHDFLKSLTESGLWSSEEVAALERSLSPAQREQDAQALAADLVRRQRLTKFQAAALCAGKGRALALGNYVILDRISQGPGGVIYKARHKALNRVVAVKVMPAWVTNDAESLRRWKLAAKAAAQLVHPNIVRIYGPDEGGGHHLLVAEFVEGSSAASIIAQRKVLTIQQGVNVLLQAARGLEFAHANGVVHGEIKPENMIIGSGGTVKIQRVDTSQTNRAAATDARDDIYALARTVFLLMTGREPYPDGEQAGGAKAPTPSLRAWRNDVPQQLDAVCSQMLALRPEHRQQSMAQVVNELKPIAASYGKAAEEQQFAGDSGLLTKLLQDSGLSTELLTASGPALPRTAIQQPGTGGIGTPQFVPAYGRPRDNNTAKVASLIGAATATALLVCVALWLLMRRPEGAPKQVVALTPESQKTMEKTVDKTVSSSSAETTDDTKTQQKKPEPITKAEAPVPEPTPKPEPKPKRSGEADRRVAQWLLTAKVGIADTKRVGDSAGFPINEGNEIPSWDFYLTSITFSGAAIEGPILDDLDDLKHLEYIFLRTQGVTDDMLRPFQKVPNLKRLILNYTKITADGVAHLTGYPKLSDLSLLYNPQITSAAYRHVAKIVALEKLTISEDSLNDFELARIATLPKLRFLSVGSDNISDDGLKSVSSLNIEYLGIGGEQITDRALIHVAPLKSLKTLSLGRTKITGAGFSHLEGIALTELDLVQNPITDVAIPHLIKLKTLVHLNIRETKISQAGAERLRKGLPNCEVNGP